MITDIVEIGKFNKPHGLNGEISATLDVDPTGLSCIIVDIDGINVPFFITSTRPKNAGTTLLRIDGVDSEEAVRMFVNKPVYALSTEVSEEERTDEDGFYASDFIGYDIIDDATSGRIGSITDIDDNTENVLFIVDTPDGGRAFIPVADEFITDIDTERRTLTMNLPQGLINLNN